jgi:hypothetical protein
MMRRRAKKAGPSYFTRVTTSELPGVSEWRHARLVGGELMCVLKGTKLYDFTQDEISLARSTDKNLIVQV